MRLEETMNRAEIAARLAKHSLLYVGLTLAVIVAVPMLAGLAYVVRILIPLLIVGALVALAVSPALRSWFVAEADNSPDYHGVAIPTASLRSHPAHGWVKVDVAGEARVGVDALAAAVLGPIVAIETFLVGSKVEQGQTLFTLSAGARRLQVKAPVSGVIARLNAEAFARPAVVAESPYGAGWVVQLQGVNADAEPVRLLHGGSLRRWFRAEVDRLTAILSTTATAPTLADGGVLAKDLSGHIDESKWAQIAAQLFANPPG
jgi:glycine cleavage system H protein